MCAGWDGTVTFISCKCLSEIMPASSSVDPCMSSMQDRASFTLAWLLTHHISQ